MDQIERLGRVALRRYLDTENRVVVSAGNFEDFFHAYLDHVRIWDEEPDGLSYTFMRQGLAGSVMHLSNAPRDQSFGITVHVHEPPTNIFFAGSSPESSITGRIYTEGIDQKPSSRLYVQSVRPKTEPTQSIVEVYGLDILEYFEQYYVNSEQRMARFYEQPDDEFMQVVSIPGAEEEFFQHLTRESAREMLQNGLTLLEERSFFFHCGCNPARMLRAVRKLFASNPAELFLGEGRVEVNCPRCGRHWWITREEFDSPPESTEDPSEDPDGADDPTR